MYKFKFFEGLDKNCIVFNWAVTENPHNIIDAEDEITRLLSAQIADEIDNEIINELTRRINSDEPVEFQGRIQRLNENVDYLNHWLRIGDNRA